MRPSPFSWPWQKEVFLHLEASPWLELARDLDTAPCLPEARALLGRFVSHRPEAQTPDGWSSLALKAHGGDEGFTAVPAGQADYRLTPAAALCPETMKLLESLTEIGECARIRFMALAPGAEIHVHSDAPDRPTSLAINIALNMPEGCEFWVDLDPDGSTNEFSRALPIRDGSVFLFNSSTYHKVVNRSAETRIHLIVHGPTRFSDAELIAKARGQNGLAGLRDLVDFIVRKKRSKGETISENSPAFFDRMNLGSESETEGRFSVFAAGPFGGPSSPPPDRIVSRASGLRALALLAAWRPRARFLFVDGEDALDFQRRLLACSTYHEVLALQESTLSAKGLLPAEGGKYVKRVMDSQMAEFFGGDKAFFMECLETLRVRADFAGSDAAIAAFVRGGERIFDARTSRED